MFNDLFEVALADLQAIVRSNQLRRQVQEARNGPLLASLLGAVD